MSRDVTFILKYVSKFKATFAILLVSILLSNFLSSLYPYLFGTLVDEVIYSKNIVFFGQIVLIYAALFLVNQIIHFILNMSWAKLSTQYLFMIKKDAFERVLKQKATILSDINSGDVVSRLNNDISHFLDIIHWSVFYGIGSSLNIIVSFVIMSKMNFEISMVILFFIPLVIIVSKKCAKAYQEHESVLKDKNGMLLAWVFEILSGLQEIKLFGANKTILNQYTAKNIDIFKKQIRIQKIKIFSERITALVKLCANIILFFMSVLFIVKGKLTIGEFVAIYAYWEVCLGIYSNLNGTFSDIANSMVSIRRVVELYDSPIENYEISDLSKEINKGNIEFVDVSFSYKEKKEILKSINFCVSAGERIAIVGKSGSGKSTLIGLLQMLYQPNRGRILIDGEDISSYNLSVLRKRIGVVHQDTILFDASIRYNISFNERCEDDANIWEALKKSNLYDFVLSLPQGLDTVIGNMGIQISGGQKQRIGIARAFYKNPQILIFDEATSSLDAEAENVINESRDELSVGRTVIVIAHRLSSIVGLDKVLVLSDGEVCGYDSHENLVKKCSEYRKLFFEYCVPQDEDYNEK